MAYQIAPFVITFFDLKGYSITAVFFKSDFSFACSTRFRVSPSIEWLFVLTFRFIEWNIER